jgi:hypothetical protein
MADTHTNAVVYFVRLKALINRAVETITADYPTPEEATEAINRWRASLPTGTRVIENLMIRREAPTDTHSRKETHE